MGEDVRTAGNPGPPASAGIGWCRLRSAVQITCALLLGAVPLAAQTGVPTPSQFLGFEPGTDRKLADYDQVYAYFQKLAATTDRVRFSSIGKTTENHELGLAIISSAKNLANLEEIRKTNLALVDPRKLKPGESVGLIARGRTIVCLNASIHSIEVGPTQATLPLAHFLATTQDPEWLAVLDDVVLLMLPCHNPDGYLKIVDWYRKWVGTPYEACPFPGLYHMYAGHDNNRDWFMFNLQETRLTVKQIYLPWVPQIVMDMHQMKEDGPRMFIPPYEDPIEPNVDPILIERLNELGLTVQKELIAKGMTGIVNRTLFDGWSPSRAYMHYHGGVRFLCEVASCRQATPIEKKGLARGAASRSSTNPAPWSGDRWSLADIVRYHNEAALAVLKHASRNRERWLTGFHEVFRRACASTEGPAAYVIPSGQTPLPFRKLGEILEFGGLECAVTTKPWKPNESRPRRALVIPRSQPFFSFARALFENVDYPEIRDAANGAIRKPYDVTAHCLPLLMNLEVVGVRECPEHDETSPFRLVGVPSDVPSGSDRAIGGLLASIEAPPAVYEPFLSDVRDAGWTRFFFRQSLIPIPCRSLMNADIADSAETRSETRRADLRVLILPNITADQILNGNRSEESAPEYRGGIGDSGAAWIDRFVRGGGTLIALKDSTALPIQVFRMPIRNALSNLPEGRRVTIPGTILRLDLDPRHPIAKYLGPSVPAFFDSGKAFEADPSADRDQSLKPVDVGRWAPTDSLRLAGYAEGLDLLAGRAALIQCRIGRGQVILFGFSPQFRCQTWATFPLLANAIGTAFERN